MIEIGVGLVFKTGTLAIRESIIPAEMRGFEMLDIKVQEGRITITPASMTCPFCGRIGTKELKGYYVCRLCIDELKKLNENKRRYK